MHLRRYLRSTATLCIAVAALVVAALVMPAIQPADASPVSAARPSGTSASVHRVTHVTPLTGASSTFYNPIADVADPTIVTSGGYYYLIGTTGDTSSNLYMRKSATLAGLMTATPTVVWSGPSSGLGSAHLWSPVLENIQGTWYIYLSVTDNNNPVQEAADYALVDTGSDPMGPYTLKAAIKTWTTSMGGSWGTGIVGPSVTVMPNGNMYLTTTTFGMYIQQMSNPWTLESGTSMVQISDGSPTLSWEGGTLETSRPIVHTVGSTTTVSMPYTSENHVTQRTNGGPCWSFCIGMFVNTDGNLTNPSSWTKVSTPVFAGGPSTGIYRILALGTFLSPDGTQNWMVFNGNDTAGTNFTQRYTFAQPFTWNSDGTPNFGTPVPLNTAQNVPSGETGSPPPLTPGSEPVNSDFSTGSSGWTVLSGSWSNCTGAYCSTGTGNNVTSAGNSSDTNYTVQAEVTPDNAPSGSGFDVIGRMQDVNDYYEFEMLKDSANNLKWVIAEDKGGTFTIVDSGGYSWAAGVTYWMRFDLNMANLTALVSTDGQRFTQLGSVRLTELAGSNAFPDFGWGAAGLRTWGGLTAHYANASVVLDTPSMGYYTGTGWPGLTIDAGDSQEANKNFCVQQYNEYCLGGYQESTTATISTAGVTDPLPMADYQTARYNYPQSGFWDGSFYYIASSLVPGQTYRVRLHFAEIYYTAAGKRDFNVLINGTQVLTNFDIYAAAGAANQAVVEEYNATANANGDITMQFTQGTISGEDGNPLINGIQVLPDSIAINSGGSAVGTFIADRDYSSSSVLSTTNQITVAGVPNAGPMALYQDERWSTSAFNYTIGNLSPGKMYKVLLHFAEIYYTQPGQRDFNVLINGTQVLTNFDKVAAAGGPDKAVVEVFTTNADSSGNINIDFTPGTNPNEDGNPTISGIEILDD